MIPAWGRRLLKLTLQPRSPWTAWFAMLQAAAAICIALFLFYLMLGTGREHAAFAESADMIQVEVVSWDADPPEVRFAEGETLRTRRLMLFDEKLEASLRRTRPETVEVYYNPSTPARVVLTQDDPARVMRGLLLVPASALLGLGLLGMVLAFTLRAKQKERLRRDAAEAAATGS